MIHVLCVLCYFLALKQIKKSAFSGLILLALSISAHALNNWFYLLLAYGVWLLPFVLHFLISLCINMKIYCFALVLCKVLNLFGEDMNRKIFLLNWILSEEYYEIPVLNWLDMNEFLLVKAISTKQPVQLNEELAELDDKKRLLFSAE